MWHDFARALNQVVRYAMYYFGLRQFGIWGAMASLSSIALHNLAKRGPAKPSLAKANNSQ